MLKKVFIFVTITLFAVILFQAYGFFDTSEQLNATAMRYARQGPQEVGAANLVTAVIVTYRGLDTLGEITILFLAASIIGFFLKSQKPKSQASPAFQKNSEILVIAAKIITPLIFLFGIYVFINGHLTPGGGFQGGAIIASGFVLMLLANPRMKINHTMLSLVESISGISFVFIGLLGIFLAAGFLDNTILGMGDFGTLISAGAIPVIYIFIGLKVGAELSKIIGNLQETQHT
jgi:multicomponent Na+:H+ antiporter subunit B